jgi:hypothetical protein
MCHIHHLKARDLESFGVITCIREVEYEKRSHDLIQCLGVAVEWLWSGCGRYSNCSVLTHTRV